MKKHVVKLSALVVAVMTGGVLFSSDAAPGPSTTVAVGTSFVVEPPMARYVAELDPRELREQVRDWAVLASVTRLGATPEAAAAATYELPPARLPYLDELYAFEYGRGRRAYLGSRVLLFRDGDDPDPQATIGRLADRVRQENGAAPAKVEVYVVHDQRDEGTIRIERAPDVTGKELFSAAYGYVEGKADSVAELAAWLARADDLSFAQLRDGHLVVGGRRFAKTRTANLTAEDVAALYQAHEQLGAPHAAARKTIRALPPAAQRTAGKIVELLKAEKLDEVNDAARELLYQARPTSREQWDSIVQALQASAAPVEGPGFSLDPKWLPDPAAPAQPLMLTRMRAFVAHPCDQIDAIVKRAAALERAEPDPTRRTSPTRRALRLREVAVAARSALGEAAVCNALKTFMPELHKTIDAIAGGAGADWDAALAVYHQLDAQLLAVPASDPRVLPAALALDALRYHAAESRAQCARYEGTKGTEVGMTMFYTDLLAKLWMSTDYGLSAPTLDVAGFVAQPRIDLSPQLAASTRENQGTRVWFGPRATGVSRVVGAGTSISFDHAFARIYAAGRDPARPGIETRPNEESRRAIGWWDRHYDDVADHEQEFHRLNQIMKWSLVTGALAEAEASRYLSAVLVRRDRELTQWHRAHHHRLRFGGAIPSSGSASAGQECLPILESYAYTSGGQSGSIAGGVGAATRASLPRVPAVNPTKPLGARKPPPVDLVGNTTGTAVRTAPRRTGKEVVFDHTAGVPMHDPRGAVALGTPRVSFKAGSKPGALEVHAGDPARPIGVVTAERNGARVQMKWRDGAVEQARHGARQSPKDLAEADALVKTGDVWSAAPVYEAAPRPPAPTALDRARTMVVDAANRRPAAVMKELTQITATGERLSPAAQELVLQATAKVGTPRAAGHVEHALARGLPLSTPGGKLVVARGEIRLTRDIDELKVAATPVPPATDLGERGVFLDSRLRIGQEGLLPDLGGQAARWQRRPDVRMAELRQQPVGLPADEVVETSTATRFHYVPPSKPAAGGHVRPPVVIRKCDDRKETPPTSDDC